MFWLSFITIITIISFLPSIIVYEYLEGTCWWMVVLKNSCLVFSIDSIWIIILYFVAALAGPNQESFPTNQRNIAHHLVPWGQILLRRSLQISWRNHSLPILPTSQVGHFARSASGPTRTFNRACCTSTSMWVPIDLYFSSFQTFKRKEKLNT